MSQSKGSGLISLKFSLSFAFVSVVVLTSLLFCVATYPGIKNFVREGIRERLGNIAGIGALQISAKQHSQLKVKSDEESQSYKSIQSQLRNIREKGTDIRYIYTLRKNDDGQVYFVVDAEEDKAEASALGTVYKDANETMKSAFDTPYGVKIESEFSTDKWGTWLTSYAPIVNEDGSLEAVLGIDISAKKVLEYENQYLTVFVLTGLIVCLVIGFLSLLISRRICKPLLLLEQDMGKVQKLELTGNIHVHSRIKEIISMESALNNMKNGLRSFRKFVPADLVNELISLQKEASLSAEKRELSIFFCDIADFTTISESLPPEELSRRLGIYFDGMTKIILRHKGTVDKYIGDCIMAFWGAPHLCDDHAERACLAAIECRDFVDGLTKEWEAKGETGFYTRFGINTGEAVVGNFGYEERLNYTVMGDSVNLASRLEGLNKSYNTKIMISESTYQQAKEKIAVKKLGSATVKGKTIDVEIYEVVGKKE
ncbi:MAG: hypothetical protein NE328_09735 [Lentisphaeraceae bacterium]|nr:hypothetical protein [Lentisphaeraceae bacterium]